MTWPVFEFDDGHVHANTTTSTPTIYDLWLESVTYRPGWRFRLLYEPAPIATTKYLVHFAQPGFPTHLQVNAEVMESNEHGTVLITHTLPLPRCVEFGKEEFLRLVLRLVVGIETHEAMEFFRVDGERLCDPHKPALTYTLPATIIKEKADSGL